jgi:TfoX/Sxy family transcriptional regulator of competence genes
MGSSLDTVQFICDQAGPAAPLTFRKMFGEFALYLDGRVVALVCDDQVYLKPTAEGRQFLGAVPEGSPYPGCRPFLMLAAELDDPERLAQAFRITAQALPAPKRKPSAAAKAVRPKSPVVKNVVVQLRRAGGMSSIPVPFDPKAVFGKVRAPVKVTLRGHAFHSTIFSMHGRISIPLRASHCEAAGLAGTEKVKVRIELDTEPRTVKAPADLLKALKSGDGLMQRWKDLSFTHQREHVEAIEGARKPETRTRRIAAAMKMLRDRPARKR